MRAMSTLRLIFAGLAVVFTLLGCAGTSKYLRSEPAGHYPSNIPVKLTSDLEKVLKLHCLKAEDQEYTDGPASAASGVPSSRCVYVSADVSNALSVTMTEKLQYEVLSTLLHISDLNCSNFTDRAFANRAGMDLAKKGTQDISSAVSAGTVRSSPSFSAALDIVNLLVGKSVDAVNDTYYLDKTFQAMQAAIEAERDRQLALISVRKAERKYVGNVYGMLSDVRRYDDACSIRSGLSRLITLAESEKDSNASKRLAVEENPSQRTFNAQFGKR